MNRNNDRPIKEIIEKLFSSNKLGQRYHETAVIAYWEELMGTAINNRTKEIYIKNKTLFVRIESSVIVNELTLMRNQIVQQLNTRVGKTIIEQMVFL